MTQSLINLTIVVLSVVGLSWGAHADIQSPSHPQAISFAYPNSIQKNSSLYEELKAFQFESGDIFALVKAAKPHVDLNRIRPGVEFRVGYGLSPALELAVVEFKLNATDFLYLEKQGTGQWTARAYQKQVVAKLADFQGVVQESLWTSAKSANMETGIIAQLSEIFAWQIDFSREVRKGDKWRLNVEKLYVEGEFIGWGRILAAEYLNAGRQFQAVLWEKDGESRGYFAPDGSSLEKIFLKSPIEFARISSRFNMKRFHPILKKSRPHLGVDYAARSGTPVRAVGDGRVSDRSYTRGGGNTLAIRHTSVYKTRYLHLKGFAKGITRGARVKQGQVIGYVGSTGMSTGPHLHFEFYKNGRFVDPLKVEFPSAESVPSAELAEFTESATQRLTSLPDYIPNDQHVATSREINQDSNSQIIKEATPSHQ